MKCIPLVVLVPTLLILVMNDEGKCHDNLSLHNWKSMK